MTRHNAALKVIFYELLKDLDLVTSIPPWYSQNMPKPLYENEKGKALWDVSLYAEYAGGEKQQDRMDCDGQEEEESGATRNELSMGW